MNSPHRNAIERIDRLSEVGSRSNFRGPRPCGLASCEDPTREGKPYCVKHVDHNPYVREVMEAIAGAEREQGLARRRGSRAVDPAGLTSSEILRELRVHGPQSPPRLSRRLGIDLGVLRVYLRALARKRVLRLVQRDRLQIVVPLEPVALSQATLPFTTLIRGA